MASPKQEESQSKKMRLEGNKHYKNAISCNFNMDIRRQNLTSAVLSFNRALSAAKTPDEFASASKNCAVVNREMASTLQKLDASLSTVKHYYRDSVAHYSKAVMSGQTIKEPAWTEHLVTAYGFCLQEYMECIQDDDPCQRLRDVEELICVMQDEFHDQVFKVTCYIKIINTLMIQGIEFIQEDDYKSAMGVFADSYRPIEEAKRLTSRQGRTDDDLDSLEKDMFRQRCIAESMQAIQTGDALFEEVIRGQELLDMDGIFEVVDWYKKAIILTRENEVELEAIVLSKLGNLYDKVLHMKEKAKENYMRSIQLAHSLHPRVFTTEEWFRDAMEGLDRYQQEQRRKEEEAYKKDRAQYLEALKDELAAIEKVEDKSYIDLMLYVYEKHPPKKGNIKLLPKEDILKLSDAEKKKLLQKAIVHYHPDKQDKECYGMKWFVLCEEITKSLTKKYECLKG